MKSAGFLQGAPGQDRREKMRDYRTKTLWVLAAAFAVISFSICHPAAAIGGEDKEAQYAKRGRALFVRYCVSCHGSSGKGDGPAAPALKSPMPDLSEISQKYGGFRPDSVATYIDGEKAGSAHGSREMPVWGSRLRDEKRGDAAAFGDIYALTKYLQTLQK